MYVAAFFLLLGLVIAILAAVGVEHPKVKFFPLAFACWLIYVVASNWPLLK